MKTLKEIFFPTFLILGVILSGNLNAQSNDGISFHNKDSGLNKRIFMLGEDLSVTVNLSVAEGKDVRTYIFNPHGKIIKDTTVNYQNPINLNLDGKVEGEYSVLANIKGSSEILRYSAAVVNPEKEGRKFEFDAWEKAERIDGKYFLGFANSAMDINEDGYLSNKEVFGYSKFKYNKSSKKFDKESNKLIVFNLPKEKLMVDPKVRLTGKDNKLVSEYSQKEHYGVVDISKATGNFAAFIGSFKGISGINKVEK